MKMKNFQKIFLSLLILLPIFLFIPIVVDNPFFHDTKWFIKYLNFVTIFSYIIYFSIFFLWLINIIEWWINIVKKEFIINYLIILFVPLILFIIYWFYFENSINIEILILWVYPVGWLELANIFWLAWVLAYISWVGWLMILFIKYFYTYLILSIFNFSNVYKYYIISFVVSLISSVTWIMMLNIFMYAT